MSETNGDLGKNLDPKWIKVAKEELNENPNQRH